MKDKEATDAPVHYGASEAEAWAAGYNAALEAQAQQQRLDAHGYALIQAVVGERGMTDASTPLHIQVQNLVAYWDREAQAQPAYERNGIRLHERVVCVDVPHLFGTIVHCAADDVTVRWDDGTIGQLVWRDDVAYNAFRLQIVRQAQPAEDRSTPREGLDFAAPDTPAHALWQAAYHGGAARVLIRIIEQARQPCSFDLAAVENDVVRFARSGFRWASAYLAALRAPVEGEAQTTRDAEEGGANE